jgi:hypothetical protein
MKLGVFTVLIDDAVRSVHARTLENVEADGLATTFGVIGPKTELRVADIRWETGDRDVRTLEISRGAGTFGRLLRGGRIGIYEADFEPYAVDVAWFELTVMKANPQAGRLPTAKKANYADLVKAAGGIDVWLEMALAGAESLGPRNQLLADDTNRRNYTVVTFPGGNEIVPTVAYVLTRVIPLSRRYSG